jgi:hypothetical protein
LRPPDRRSRHGDGTGAEKLPAAPPFVEGLVEGFVERKVGALELVGGAQRTAELGEELRSRHAPKFTWARLLH